MPIQDKVSFGSTYSGLNYGANAVGFGRNAIAGTDQFIQAEEARQAELQRIATNQAISKAMQSGQSLEQIQASNPELFASFGKNVDASKLAELQNTRANTASDLLVDASGVRANDSAANFNDVRAGLLPAESEAEIALRNAQAEDARQSTAVSRATLKSLKEAAAEEQKKKEQAATVENFVAQSKSAARQTALQSIGGLAEFQNAPPDEQERMLAAEADLIHESQLPEGRLRDWATQMEIPQNVVDESSAGQIFQYFKDQAATRGNAAAARRTETEQANYEQLQRFNEGAPFLTVDSAGVPQVATPAEMKDGKISSFEDAVGKAPGAGINTSGWRDQEGAKEAITDLLAVTQHKNGVYAVLKSVTNPNGTLDLQALRTTQRKLAKAAEDMRRNNKIGTGGLQIPINVVPGLQGFVPGSGNPGENKDDGDTTRDITAAELLQRLGSKNINLEIAPGKENNTKLMTNADKLMTAIEEIQAKYPDGNMGQYPKEQLQEKQDMLVKILTNLSKDDTNEKVYPFPNYASKY